MARKLQLNLSKSYATPNQAHLAVQKRYGENNELTYFIYQDWDPLSKHFGRFAPVFVGKVAMEYGVFNHFNIIGG